VRVLFLNTDDIGGGASRAAYRLHKGLQASGIDSRMLVQHKISDDASVLRVPGKLARVTAKLYPHLDTVPLRLYPQRQVDLWSWSIGWLPSRIEQQVGGLAPDIVHLHWINYGFISINALTRLNRPLIWTLHDMWAFTGGCHYDQGCGRYRQACGACPQLASTSERDLSRWVWRSKWKAWRGMKLIVVTPSRWLADCAKASALFHDVRVETIPNGLDLTTFRPIDRGIARHLLSLPQEKDLILFGAMSSTSDRRKGFQYLQPALQRLGAAGRAEKVELVVFGASQPANAPDFGLPVRYLGQFHDDISLALVYAAADVFVAPSIQDNLPNTVMEALACGTPCVAFNIGGMSDLIEHERTGYLARPLDIDELACGIAWVLDDIGRRQMLRCKSRAKAELEFEISHITRKYAAMYQDALLATGAAI
jgi:glycosyltransferase involved in cell wall biosynthesis